ncbi:MAG TPA: diguanylate cyclase [Trueperaceae bacterium]
MKTSARIAQLNEQAWQQVGPDTRKALALAEEAAAEARRLEDGLQLGLALRTVGACKLETGELAEARRVLAAAEEVLRDLPECQSVLAQVFRLRSRVCFISQEYEKALRFIHAGLQACKESEDPQLEAAVLNQAGTTYAHLGSYEEGLEYLLASLEVLEKAGLDATGHPLNNIGNIYMLQGDPERALDFFERAKRAFDETGTGRDRVIALGNIGRALEELGDTEGARARHEEGVVLARETEDPIYLPPALTKLARVMGKLGRTEEALNLLMEALELCPADSSPFREEPLMALANLHLAMGAPGEAERLYRETIRLAVRHENRQLEAEALLGLSRALEGAERWREALEAYHRHQELAAAAARELFSNKTQALLLHNEVKQSKRDRKLLRDVNEQLKVAYAELEAKSAELERLSLEDPLTKLFNRRQLERRMADEIARLERYGERFSLLMCDVDDFKAINDRFSHGMGDQILVQLAQILISHTRSTDLVARVGGEEFLLLLPHTAAAEAAQVAEKVRAAVVEFPWDSLGVGTVTVSIGVAEGRLGEDASALMGSVDRELYRAKRSGKNRVCVAPAGSGEDDLEAESLGGGDERT